MLTPQNQTQGYNQQPNQEQNHRQNMYNNGGQFYQGYGGNNNQMFNDPIQSNMYTNSSAMNGQQQQQPINSLSNNQYGSNGLLLNNHTNMNQYDFNANYSNNNNNNNNNGYGMNNPYDQTMVHPISNTMGGGNQQLLLNYNSTGSSMHNYGNTNQISMNYNQPMNTNNNYGNPNNNTYYNTMNNSQMMNQQMTNIQIDPLRMNQRISSTPQTPIDNFSDREVSPSSSTSFDSTSSAVVTEAVRIVFPLGVDFNDVLFNIKLTVPELVGNILNEEKVKPVLTTNKKKQLIWVNISTYGIAKIIKEKCSSIKYYNEPLEITIDNKPKKTVAGVYSIEIPTGIKAVALDKFFSDDLRRELSQMSGGTNNSFEIKDKTITFKIQPTQPNIQNVQQYLQNLVIKLLQPARFVEFYYENSNEKKDQVQKKLPPGVYLYIEESKKNFTTWHLTSLSDIYNNQLIIDLFKIKFSIPKDDFDATKKELFNKNIQFKYTKQNENFQIECTLKSESEYKVFNKIKKGDTKNPVTIETTQYKFLRKFSSHLLKSGQIEFKCKRDEKDASKMIVLNVPKKARQLLQAELKKIKSVKLELQFIHASLKEDVKKEGEKYFEQLTEIQTASTVLAPEKSKNIIILFAIVENQENEMKIRNELSELLKGSSDIVQAKQVNEHLLKKVTVKTKIDKFKKDISSINVDFDSNKKTFYIKGLRDEDVKEVKSRIESELLQSKEKRIKLTFNNIIEKNLALPLLKSVQQNNVKILEQGLSITLVAPSQDMYKFIDNSYHRVMMEVRKKVLVDFIRMQHDEFKFFSEKNIETKGKVVLEKKLDSGIKEVHKIENSFIYICQGDMFDKKWKAQVLVNSANDQLAHGGGIAAQCLEKCGKQFDQECKNITTSLKLKPGDVVPTTAGNLSYLSKIYNAIPPMYDSNNHLNSCSLLEQTVVNILTQAEKDGYCSIIIPALSSGIFGFPLDQSTDIIVRTIYKYAPQLSCLREIILIGDINTVTESFSKSINLLQTDLVYTLDTKNDSSFIEIEQDEYVGCFKYFDDIKKMYLPFTVNDNRKLCQEYEKDPKSTFILNAEQGKKYQIDFDKMEQIENSSKFKRKIIYVPTMDTEHLTALWLWLADDNKTWNPYRENQMKEIERSYNERNTECNVLMTNEKYTSEDIKYFVKFDYLKEEHVQVNSQTQYVRRVKRIPIQKIVKCNIDVASDLNKNSILYVYDQDDNHYTFVSGSAHNRILITDTVPIQIVKSVSKTKYASVTESVYSFRLYGEASDVQSFELNFRNNIKESYITESLTKSCNKFVIDHILSEHASMKAKFDNGMLKIDMNVSPFTITGFKYTVDKFKEYALLTIADKPELLSKFSYPQDWQLQTSNVILINLSQSSNEWKMINDRIKLTIPNAVIQNIEKVQNQLVYQSYKTEQDRINKIKIDSNGQYSTDPQLLFHGTRSTDPSIIYDGHEGFDMRFSNTGMWGIGCYFAVNASYSNGYAFPVPGTNYRKFFLAEVLTGDFHSCSSNSNIRIPPLKPNSAVRYDSVKGNTGGSDIFIVYKNSQAYPKYLITYSLQ
ncbi:poly ADP-ribose polymerase family, member 14-like protein [Naegleria gruberi]|uniref:Poly [ADP-ribose] polymerase n=1 Tax=Naegleria gruberi TaxID=5762 RepID=D2VM45_NAEGR|nr:poly ADP-ribose polymerase family, member 14-like protein [Naegleria gruberi]EFC42255.1 poly ADP-ribose polymerase family, member 14-like protein [Naegleria gruberi]|eukprot:XP_002674999.1 poly ADP-ribose polymerase family, member 14-like protein [Naegleria gruberi strain NEG-M]